MRILLGILFFLVYSSTFGEGPFLPIDSLQAIPTLQLSNSQFKTDVLFMGGYDVVTDKNGWTAISKLENDYTGYFPIDGRSDSGYIIVNHERNQRNSILGDGGGMTVFTAYLDTESGRWKVAEDSRGKYRNVDFSVVGGTYYNCGGIETTWGTVLTGEEHTFNNNRDLNKKGQGITDTSDYLISQFNGDVINKLIPSYKNFGWMVEVNVAEAKAIRKIYEAGRYDHEAGVLMQDGKTVYICDDNTPGFLYKYIANMPGDLNKGNLYAYRQGEGGLGGEWLPLPMDIDSMVDIRQVAARRGASMFIRTEWALEYNGKIYISETGKDDTKDFLVNYYRMGAQLPLHLKSLDLADGEEDLRINDYFGRILVLDTATNQLNVFLEGGKGTHTSNNFAQPDCINLTTIGDKSYMVIQEDISGLSMGRVPPGVTKVINEIYWLDMSIEHPVTDDLIRFAVGPPGCETTGGRFTPDGNTFFFNIQHPGPENEFPFNYPCTIAVSGFNNLAGHSIHRK